ncbi:unnamed protein product [Camellia sinensis]
MTRKLESLEALKKTFKKLDHDENIQDFLGSRDLRLHKLVFQDDALPDGTELAYFGFAIGSVALVYLALFGAFVSRAGNTWCWLVHLFLVCRYNHMVTLTWRKCQLIYENLPKISTVFLEEALPYLSEKGNCEHKACNNSLQIDYDDMVMVGLAAMQDANSTLEDFTRNEIRLVAPAIVASLGALKHTLGTLVPVIGAGRFATAAAAIAI